jgi:phytoene dehydrogenase-like protein
MAEAFDYLVLGAGMGGLAAGSLLAKAGYRVCLLEAHEYPGGCAHTFPMGQYSFCAAVHYIFFCGEGEPVHNFLRKLELHEAIRFCPLDPNGYDRFRCPAEQVSFDIPNGLPRWRDRLIARFPAQCQEVNEFFDILERLVAELRRMPYALAWHHYATAAIRFPYVFRYRTWTLQQLFDRLRLSPELQAILATQVGDLGLPPAKVSLPIFAALVWGYCQGAYHPAGHFRQFIHAVANVIACSPGSRIEYNTEVESLEVERGQIKSVRTKDGRKFYGRAVISNVDPRRCVEMIGRCHFPAPFLKQIDYQYSVSSFTLYLGIRGLDLRDYGFGNFNVWHYPHLDINRCYRQQTEAGDLHDPWLFLSTPTLYACDPAHAVCPDGHQILEAVTVCDYRSFRQLRDRDPHAYHRAKQKITARILEILETHYIPGLRNHVALKVAGSPTTNERFLWAPAGNIYGSELTPKNVDFARLRCTTPIPNLYFTGASAEFPSIAGTVIGGSRLYTHLTGDSVNPGRDHLGMV